MTADDVKKKIKPQSLTKSPLFVRSPDVGQMKDPLKADWNHAPENVAQDKPAQSGNIDLAELIDFSHMNAIFQNFLEVVGLPQAIIDLEGQVLASSNWQRLCMDFHRVNPGTLQRCLESDINLSREMQEGKPYAIYRCCNGLTDCASPIVIEGQHVANLFIGQFLLAPPNQAYFEAQRAEFGFDKEAYLAALSEVPIISEEELPAILNLLSGLAHQIAMQSLAEHRAKVAYESVELQVIERTAQLLASTELLQHVTSNVPGMVYQYRLWPDGNSRFPYASEGVRDLFHVTPEEAREDASKVFSKIHPDDYDAATASIQESAQDLTPWHHEFRVKFNDDMECWLLSDALPQREADGSTLWHGFITDITERKRLEQEREQYFRFFRLSTDLMCIADPFGCFKQVNPALVQQLGFEESELVTKPFLDFILPEDRQRTADEMKLQVAVRPSLNFENRFVCKDGKVISLLWTAYFDKNDGTTYATARNITELKQAEETARASEERLRLAMSAANQGWFDVDLRSGKVVVSPEYIRMIGFDKDEFITDLPTWLENIHPDDRDAVAANFQACVQNGGPSSMEYRRLTKCGDWKWIQSIGKIVQWDADQRAIRMIGIHADITDRKHMEDAMRITASVFDNTQDAILITDANNVIIEVNPAFTRITGYSHEEVIGKNPNFLSSGRQDNAFFARMWQSLNQERSWRGEIWNRRKSGEVYAELISISAICDNGGKVLRYVAVFSDISHLKAHEAELNLAANYDALTGIPNRILLADRMKQAIAQTAREQNMMAICYLDLDGFKPINDTMGHDAGDKVLVEVAKRIENTIRGGDTVARIGGDEFVVLLLSLEKGEEFLTILNRLLAAIAHPITIKNKSLTISASIGVSIYPLDDEDPDTLLRHADQAMYVAKQSGKDRFHIYDPAPDRRARDQHAFLKSIRHALEQGQFELYYQPKINLRTKELIGAEALIRWRHPERGLLLPAEFLHHIENTDLDIEVGDWVTAKALAQMNHWRSTGLDIEVSINISGYHLESPHFVERLQQQLAHYPDMPVGKLQIEVLETVALNDIAIVRGIIESCREIGVRFALDDFGTGYSSLSYLSGLPVDVLKIDQSFVRDMLEDNGDKTIVQGIIALARAFGRQTVAEGIETEEHYQLLIDMGCELGQGYYIARPMPADKLMSWRGG